MINVHSDKGQEILNYLKKNLEMPENVIEFELHLKLDSIVMIKNMSYCPQERNDDTASI